MKDNFMEQVNKIIPLSPPSRTGEPLGAGEYNADTCDIATQQLAVDTHILQQAELPSRRWLMEASRPSTTHNCKTYPEAIEQND